jgi:hypothetical protein
MVGITTVVVTTAATAATTTTTAERSPAARVLARPTGTGGTCRRRPFAAAAATPQEPDEPALSETTNVHEHPGWSRPL